MKIIGIDFQLFLAYCSFWTSGKRFVSIKSNGTLRPSKISLALIVNGHQSPPIMITLLLQLDLFLQGDYFLHGWESSIEQPCYLLQDIRFKCYLIIGRLIFFECFLNL